MKGGLLLGAVALMAVLILLPTHDGGAEAKRGRRRRRKTSRKDDVLRGWRCADPPSSRGPCAAAIEAWTFVEGSGRCERLDYGGCGATDNFFYSKYQCEQGD